MPSLKFFPLFGLAALSLALQAADLPFEKGQNNLPKGWTLYGKVGPGSIRCEDGGKVRITDSNLDRSAPCLPNRLTSRRKRVDWRIVSGIGYVLQSAKSASAESNTCPLPLSISSMASKVSALGRLAVG